MKASDRVILVFGQAKNPLDGIVPDFEIFGAKFTSIWQKLAAGLWGLGIAVAVVYLGIGILGIAQNQGGGHPGQMKESKKQAVQAGWGLGGLIALGSVVTVFISIFS